VSARVNVILSNVDEAITLASAVLEKIDGETEKSASVQTLRHDQRQGLQAPVHGA